MALSNFCLSLSFDVYSGSSKWLKQVCAVGNLSVSGPCLPTYSGSVANPFTGARSHPVVNCKNCFL